MLVIWQKCALVGGVATSLLFYKLYKGESTVYYHFTDKKGADGIISSGYVKPSHGDQGDVVYLTRKSPFKYSAKEIAKSVYGDDSKYSKTERVLKLKIPAGVKKVSMKDQEDTWVYTGPLYLVNTEKWAYIDWSSGEKGHWKILKDNTRPHEE